jgi:membrane protein implicated in regulation of membrane protease activity
MIEYIDAHQSGFWIAAGFLMLAAEVLLFGFTTIVLLFAGLGAIVTGLLMMAGLLPQTWIAGTACFGISAGIIGVLLWRPMRKMQDRQMPPSKQISDFIGLEFTLMQDVTAIRPGQHRYSGVDWKVELDHTSGVDNVSAGQRVAVTSVDAGIFRVKPV